MGGRAGRDDVERVRRTGLVNPCHLSFAPHDWFPGRTNETAAPDLPQHHTHVCETPPVPFTH